jgi:chromosome transmission fidelity protein 18
LFLATQAPTRYAVRQVLDQELQKTIKLREIAMRQARFKSGHIAGVHDDYVFDDKENSAAKGPVKDRDRFMGSSLKKDFFGRVIIPKERPLDETDGNGKRSAASDTAASDAAAKVWVTYHEGLNNAVRKPISLEEFMRGF